MDYYLCPFCGGHCKDSKLTPKKNICKNCNLILDEEDVFLSARKPLLKNVSEDKIEDFKKTFSELGLFKGQILQLLHLDELPKREVLEIMKERRVGFLKASRINAWNRIDVLLSTEP